MKTKFRLRAVSLIIAVVTALSLFSVASFSASAAINSVVTTDAVRLRSTPQINDDNYITTLGVSETLTLLADSENGWANVKRSNGSVGYCSVDYLNVPSGSTVEFRGKTTAEVNFRKGPSTDYDVIGYLEDGQQFRVLDNSEELWVKAESGNKEGYIYRSYTDLTLVIPEDKPQVPTEPSKPTEPAVSTEPSTEATYPAETPTEIPTEPSQSEKPQVNPLSTPNWHYASLLESDGVSSKITLTGKFTLSRNTASIKTGESIKLSTLILGTSADSLVSYKSSDSKVAKVNQSGIVTGLTEGEAVITASFRGKEALCTVSVTGKPYVPEVPTEPQVPTDPMPTEPSATVPQTTILPTDPGTFELSASAAKVEKGNFYVLTSPLKNTQWSSSNENVATVDGKGMVEALNEGKAVITATADGKTASCTITVIKSGTGLTIEYSEIKITKGKTFYNSADSSANISWTSSDKNVATVSNGFITAVGEGTAVITAGSSKGTKTCLVTVKKAEPVRFAYAYPNTVAKNENVNLVAITDKNRTAVQFKVNINGETKTVNATGKKTDGNTIVWTGTTSIDTAGTFKVTAFAKQNSVFESCSDSKTTVFVRESKDLLKETKEERRVSDELITMLAGFEGYVGNVYADELAGGIPTLGYGRVVYTGESFYNDMTKTEALSMLYDTVNNGGYSSNVNSYLASLDANYNQQQFDALVSFAYNIGYYGLKSDSEIRALILEAKEKKHSESPDKNAAYINGTQINLRSGAGTNFDSLGWLSYPDALTLLEDKLINSNWYHVKTADGREGYIYKDYVTKGTPAIEGEIYLSLINKDEFTRVLLEYHHAGSSCIYGLLYRRADELDAFYYGDYERDGEDNRFGYSFTCYKDSNFTL